MYKLMIVDDSMIIRNRIENSFKNTDVLIVGTASNGQEAVNLFLETRPDIVTMDLTMPQMDGLECIEKLVSYKTGVSILVVSALSDKATGLKALQLGARGFICKPFNADQLVDALNKLIKARRAGK